MAKPNSEQSDADASQELDMENLLNQVEDLTKQAENLVTENETPPKPKHSNLLNNLDKAKSDKSLPSESEEDIFKFDHIDDLMDPTMNELDMSTTNIEDNDFNESDKNSSCELNIDPKIQELAEDEINQIYTKISPENLEEDFTDEVSDQKTKPDTNIDIITLPTICKNIMMILFTINRPFFWLPNSIRNGLGYFGLATFIFGLSLWSLLILKY